MNDWTGWFVAAGILVCLELFSGTFYLLMIAIGFAAGGLAALAGVGGTLQIVGAAIIGVLATYALRRSKYGKSHNPNAASDPNINLDIGQTILVNEWKTDVNAPPHARESYRGAPWDIELAHGEAAVPGNFTIREIRGSRLIVANTK